MKTIVSILLLIGLAVPVAAGSVDRSQPPPVGPPRAFTLPKLQSFELSNGLEVVLLERHQVPLVQINVLVEAGRARETAGQYGLANFTADMLDEGAGDHSALELAEAFEFLGARFSISSSAHTATVSLRVPAERLEPALELMSDVVLRPAFSPEELERLRAERLTTLLSQHDEPNVIARTLYDRTLFGEAHPYGRANMGNETSVRGIGIDDMRGFYNGFYRPNNAALIVVGDATPDGVRPLLEKAFGGWESRDVPEVRVPEVFQVEGRVVYLVDKPGSAQSVIRMGRLGARRLTDDYYALEVLNTVLGGAFTSRLMQNLREDKGYTYGARSRFSYGRVTGPFTASASVQTDVTGPSLAEFMKELNAIMEPIPDDELDRARNYLAMGFPQEFASVASVTSQIESLQRYGLPGDHYDHFMTAVLDVTEADVSRVANTYLDAANMVIVIVGDRKTIEAQVA
jgi:predicted Zn-dependent peptidase